MPLHDFLQGDSLLLTAADPFQRALGQIHVLDILQVFEDGFTDIVRLGAPGPPGQPLPLFASWANMMSVVRWSVLDLARHSICACPYSRLMPLPAAGSRGILRR